MRIMKAAGWTAAVLASLAGYGLQVTSHAHASVPGHSVRAPRWLGFQAATRADKRHFGVHGKCVIELASSGHGWIICRDGQSASIPGAGRQVVTTTALVTSEPRRITLAGGESGLAIGSLRWDSAYRASGQLDFTGEDAGFIGQVRVTVRRDRGAITALRLAGDTQGLAKSWTFRHGHWSAS